MNKAILIFLCLFAFVINQCSKVNVEGKLPNLFECFDAKESVDDNNIKKCCLAAFKSGGKYYSYCSDLSKKELKKELKDYDIIEIICDD